MEGRNALLPSSGGGAVGPFFSCTCDATMSEKKATSSVLPVDAPLDDGAPDHTFGSRTLDADRDVWSHNAWYVEAAR